MRVSVVIPTYNRPKDLETVLKSLLYQTELPIEVIIVDDSDNDEIENLSMRMMDSLKEKSIAIIYLRNKREKSLTIARNIGIEHVTGDIVLFLDDDVILDRDYIKEILKVYEERPNALGVQGYMNYHPPKAWRNLKNKIYFYLHVEKNKCRFLPSTYITYPYSLKGVINCQWLHGTNQSYKREILKIFRFDEKMKRYSFKEDLDLSYRIFKKYPYSLYITPFAKLTHTESSEGRLSNKEWVYMEHVHSYYLFFKIVDQNLKNKLIFSWSVIGLFFRFLTSNSISLIQKPSKTKLLRLKYLIGSRIFCIRHLEELKNGKLMFFNKTLNPSKTWIKGGGGYNVV